MHGIHGIKINILYLIGQQIVDLALRFVLLRGRKYIRGALSCVQPETEKVLTGSQLCAAYRKAKY